MIEFLIYALTLFGTLSVVGAAGSSGLLNSAFQRGFAGVSTQVVSSNFLLNYTNTESFLWACYEGQVGLVGYVFMLSLGLLLATWGANLYNYRQAII